MKFRFQRLFFSALAALSLGFGPALAWAEDYNFKVTGKVCAYYGQYNPGVEGESARLTEFNEAKLAGSVERGPVSAYFEIESRQDQLAYAYQRRLDYKLADLKLSIGTQVPKESYAFAAGDGTGTSESSLYGFYKGLLLKTELDGLRLEYKFDKIKLGLTSYEADALNTTSSYLVTSGNGTVSGTKSTTPTSSEGTLKTQKPDSATQAGGLGELGALEFRLSWVNSVTDDHKSGTTKLNHSANLVGLSLSLDGASKLISQDATFKKKYAANALQLVYTFESGPALTLTLGIETYQDEKTPPPRPTTPAPAPPTWSIGTRLTKTLT
ncbi:MAG: hypothetical protein A2600_12525 [Candidatus Lambdaproteobacteria bacterium RIFOXYD1_FULL_56_27]|uniref:Porin domain-containing protein n=1 Tax=Candidatus Lambdaproteobacteria bacterium RIFOXYD2_FULL_56_26 TaxID=1817773 RepID=A0A1F6GSP4_9PROT|nr:MAG: hypothetical protein A2426_07200 [Candidatus Lambdaproteobacteria bacterium RIFOXYC1_FULL_56_13]OGH01206.1 MAG: hypothetical protein A2557_00925 [Candidatus Lambdaproteobacteria bacterium RIFOXYD2_FULL_56_26]OGH06473.1 MAG: hypothetical protein A2600_12525 [Candidatus Lambdaproteobacteria bacterium RIFOXYD1_FULL_56_27]